MIPGHFQRPVSTRETTNVEMHWQENTKNTNKDIAVTGVYNGRPVFGSAVVRIFLAIDS